MYSLDVGYALSIAEIYHRGQLRRKREPYIEHLKRVAVAAGKEFDNFAIIGLLHDILEDTRMTEAELREMFNGYIVDAVVLLTREEGMSKEAYLQRLLESGNEAAIVVKYHDACDNAIMAEDDEVFTMSVLNEDPKLAKARYETIAYRCRMKLKQLGYKTFL